MGLEEEDRSEEPCLSLKVFFFKYLHLFLCYINGIGFYLFMAVLGLHCCAGFSLVVVSGGLLSLLWLLLVWSTGSRTVGLQQLGRTGLRAPVQWLCRMGLVAPQREGSSWPKD